MSNFIEITNDGEHITSPMPADETVVDVKLKDGTETRAWYSQDLMEPGDFDFVPVTPEGEPDDDADSIAHLVVAWRKSH